MESVPDSGHTEAQSFEISRWFSTILDRIDNVQSHQRYLNKWRNIALKLKRSKRIERVKYVQAKFRQKKCSRSSKSNWFLFYSKLWHRKKKYIFNMARNQLFDAKQRAEDLRRAKKILMIPESESEYESEDSGNTNLDENPNGVISNKTQYNDLSPNGQKWISIVSRFVNQTKYNELHQAYQDFLDELKYQEKERRDTWQYMAHTLIWNIKKGYIKKCHKNFKQARQNWHDLYSNYILTSKLNYIKNVYSKWNSRSLKTDSQVRRCWKRFYFSMRFKKNIIRMVRESSALSTLTNFFRYIILIRRSTAVAKYFPIRYIATIRSMVKQSAYDSADKIHNFASMKVLRDSDAFSDNWSNCIAEAFSNVASRQVGPPVSMEQRKKRIKPSKNHSKPSNKANIKNNSIKTSIQTIQSKDVSNTQDIKNQEISDSPIKIIKITRDFDPNEEESQKEVITYLSDSSGSSDGGNDKFNDNKFNDSKNSKETTHTNNQNLSNEQIIILSSSKEKPKQSENISIEVNPSGSQSTASVDEYVNNGNSDNDNNQNLKFQNLNKPNKAKLRIETSAYQEMKPIKKKKQKQKELYAPIVIPKRKRPLSPIRKKRVTKYPDDSRNPSINDILGLVGISSSLELLDEGSDTDISNSSSIHFRFDDESSDPIEAPYKDLVVDLINVNTSDEERRIHQSLLEASQASSNPPNEEEDRKLPNLKEERKIDLMSSSQTNNQNGLISPEHDISTSPFSYNSNSDFEKEKEFSVNANEKQKDNENAANNNSLFEEEEGENEPPPHNISDEKTDLIKSIGNEEEERIIIHNEEEDVSCKFNFESEKNDEKSAHSIKPNPHSISEQKSLEGPSDSYISDRDVDAAMHEYSSDNTTK